MQEIHAHAECSYSVCKYPLAFCTCQPYVCRNWRRDEKARSGRTCSSKSRLIQVALLEFLLWVKLVANHTWLGISAALALPRWLLVLSLSQRGPGLVVRLLAWEIAASLGNADAAVCKTQGPQAKGREGTSCTLPLVAGEMLHSAVPGGSTCSLCSTCSQALRQSYALLPYFPGWRHSFVGGSWDCRHGARAMSQKRDVSTSTWGNSVHALQPRAFEQVSKVLKKKWKQAAILCFMPTFLSFPWGL